MLEIAISNYDFFRNIMKTFQLSMSVDSLTFFAVTRLLIFVVFFESKCSICVKGFLVSAFYLKNKNDLP